MFKISEMKKYHVWRTNSLKTNKPVHAFFLKKKQHSFKQYQTEINKNVSNN